MCDTLCESLKEFSENLEIAKGKLNFKGIWNDGLLSDLARPSFMFSFSIHQILYIWRWTIMNSMQKLKITAGN